MPESICTALQEAAEFENEIDLQPYLEAYKREDVNLLGFYARMYGDGKTDNVDEDTHVYRDTELGISLMRTGVGEIVVLGFELEPRGVMRVQQIQFARNPRARRSIGALRTPQMMLRIAVDQAREYGLRRVKVQRAENNEYWKARKAVPRDTTLKEHQARLKMRYDVTARRSGFRYSPRMDCYVMDL